jgi:hypothetical protein
MEKYSKKGAIKYKIPKPFSLGISDFFCWKAVLQDYLCAVSLKFSLVSAMSIKF